MSALDRYRAPAPDGVTEGEPCPRHPAEELVWAEIPCLDLTDGEAACSVRGLTCARCFTPRGFAVERVDVEALVLVRGAA